MKKVLLFLFLVCFCLGANAQITHGVKIRGEVEGATLSSPKEPDDYHEEGITSILVTIDRTGKVIDVDYDLAGSTIDSTHSLWRSSFSAARQSSFWVQSDADTLRGKIIYNYYKYTSEQLDSVKTTTLHYLSNKVDRLIDEVQNSQYYKLYPTDNIWTFIELDTVFGGVRKVQYTVSDDSRKRFWRTISFDDLRKGGSWLYEDKIVVGRYELYKTQNIYNFILLDKLDGRVWQVQWSMDGENDLLIPITR